MYSEFFLAVFIPWIITVCLFIIIIAFLFSLPEIVKGFLRLPNLVKLLLLSAIIGGAFIRFYWTPFTHRIYYDEDRYLTYTVAFAKYNKAESIVVGTPKKLVSGFPDEAVRLTLPVANAWILKTFGYNEHNLFVAAKILNSLQIPLIFIFSYLLFSNFTVALFATFGMAFLPNNIYWSTSITLDPYFVTFSLIAMVSTCLYALKPNLKNGALFIAALFTLFCVRIEAFLFLPIIILTIIFLRKQSHEKKFLQKIDLLIYLVAVFFIGLRALASISVLGKQWCCAENLPLEAFYPDYFIRNLLPNIYNLFNRVEFPFLITVLAIIAAIKINNKKMYILLLWIVSYFVIYSLYYAGMFYTFEYSGSYGRYFLILCPAILILAGLSVDLLFKQSKKFILISILIFMISLTSLFTQYRTLISTSPFSKLVDDGPIFIHNFIYKTMIPNTPKNSILISNLPAMTIMTGHPAAFLAGLMEDKTTQDFIRESLKNKVKVYSTIPYNCVDLPQQCEEMFKLFQFIPYNVEKNKTNFQFAEVLLQTPKETK